MTCQSEGKRRFERHFDDEPGIMWRSALYRTATWRAACLSNSQDEDMPFKQATVNASTRIRFFIVSGHGYT